MIYTTQGQIKLDQLIGHTSFNAQNISQQAIAQVDKHNEGYQSIGWQFAADECFDLDRLIPVLRAIHAPRVKGVFICEQGILGYNRVDDEEQLFELDDCLESRLELITDDHIASDQLLQQLQQCRTKSPTTH